MEKNKGSAPVYVADLFSYGAIGLLNLAMVKTQSLTFFGLDLDITDIKTSILVSLPGVGFIIAHYLGVFLTFVSTTRAERQLHTLNEKYKKKCIEQLSDPLLDQEEKDKIKKEYTILSADERALASASYSASRDRLKKADENFQSLKDQSPESNAGLDDMLKIKNK